MFSPSAAAIRSPAPKSPDTEHQLVLMLNAIARGCPAAFACYLLFVPPAAGETLPDTIDDGLVQAARPGSLTSPILATILAINERPDLVSAIVERSVAVSPENAADIASAA